MAAKILRSLAVSAFCEDMAMMLAAGIQVDDALSLMRGDSEDGPLYDAASAVLERVQMGEPLAEAVEQCGYFPAYAAQLVAAGEAAGRTESVLKSLAVYYETQDKLEKRLKSAVIYPAVLLFLMAGVLAVLVARVLPVFTGVYTGLAGSVAASSYAYITAANIIGWASLCLVIVLTALLLTGAAAARTQRGNGLFRTLFEKLPFTSAAARRLAEAQFTTALATFTASGMDTDTAMERASDMVRHRALRAQLESCRRQMLEGRSLAQAVYDNRVFEPLYARMLMSGARSGNLDQVLARLAQVFSADGAHHRQRGTCACRISHRFGGDYSSGRDAAVDRHSHFHRIRGRGDVSGKTAAARRKTAGRSHSGSMYTAAVAGCMGCLERRTGGNEGTGGAEPPHGGAGCGGAVLRS